MAVRASRTSSSLNGLMIAITIFMGPIPAWARYGHDRAFSTEVHHAERTMFATRSQPGPLESNAVPDRPHCLTDYERAAFRALRECPQPALFGRAYDLITCDLEIGNLPSGDIAAHPAGSLRV